MVRCVHYTHAAAAAASSRAVFSPCRLLIAVDWLPHFSEILRGKQFFFTAFRKRGTYTRVPLAVQFEFRRVRPARIFVSYPTSYGLESWALKKCDEKLLIAFEMWVWRRMPRISWTERKTNTWIREKIGIPEEKGILEQIKQWNSKYCHGKEEVIAWFWLHVQLRVK